MFRTLVLPLGAVLSAACLLPAPGCGSNGDYLTADRLNNGLVIILPGIEGESDLNRDVRRGLIAGGVYRALPIHSWGRPVPLAGPLINQVDFLGNRLAGIGVANMIRNYQDSHPGRPVHVVGHSGGGGIAVFAAEALPEGRKIDGLILLSASISSAYDLTKAASRCTKGIVNFYNPDDALLLGGGTTIFGNVDGTHGPSAGLLGFDRAGKNGMENVFQVRVQSGDDPHAATTRAGFVSVHVAPWVLVEHWPAGPRLAMTPDLTPIPAAAPMASAAPASTPPAPPAAKPPTSAAVVAASPAGSAKSAGPATLPAGTQPTASRKRPPARTASSPARAGKKAATAPASTQPARDRRRRPGAGTPPDLGI